MTRPLGSPARPRTRFDYESQLRAWRTQYGMGCPKEYFIPLPGTEPIEDPLGKWISKRQAELRAAADRLAESLTSVDEDEFLEDFDQLEKDSK